MKREEINKILVSELREFRHCNNMSLEEAADFFGLKDHKLRNWINAGTVITLPDLWKIESIQRGLKGYSLKYKINTLLISTGFQKTEKSEELELKLESAKKLLVEKEKEVFFLKKSNNSTK